jgi:hypothetical protein
MPHIHGTGGHLMNKQASAQHASRSHPLTRYGWLITSFAAAALTACDGSHDDPPAAVAQPITGTAAAGAPVVGTVTVKDSTGASKTSPIAADGSYSVNVAGMTGPFVFLADGTVGGRSIQMVSAATNADINKTINITPFTDLIVANMAGQAATAYFASPVFSKLTATELDAARQTLTTRLLPILNALGVAAGFDLLRSSFAADHSGFDAVMDVVRVNTDAATLTATITDLVNHTQIQDDLASKTDATVITAPSASLADTVASLKGIEDTLTKFSAAFATGVPASNNAALRALMSSDFLDWGGDAEGFLSEEGVLASWMVGVKQSGASISAVKDGGATLDVEFLSVYKGGGSDRWQQQFHRTGNVWQYAGNRRTAYVEAYAVNARFPQQSNSWEYRPYVGTWMWSRNTQAAYALLSGPGMPNWAPSALAHVGLTGVVLGRSGSSFRIYSINNLPESTWAPDCATPYGQNPWEVICINLAQVTAGATYTYTLLDASGVAIGSPETVRLLAKPHSATETSAAADAWFPRLVSSDPATKAGLVNGKRVTVTTTPPADTTKPLWRAALGTSAGRLETDVTGTTTELGVWSGAAPDSAQIVLTARDAAAPQRFVSFYDFR